MEDDNDWVIIFRSGNKFYVWVRVGDEVDGILSQDIREIASEIARSDFRGLARKPLDRTSVNTLVKLLVKLMLQVKIKEEPEAHSILRIRQ